jgi:MoxR-like ATPase
MQRGKDSGKSSIRKRIHDLIASICEGMVEREETISVALLGALCGQNTFLYGPPGTAKSLISRRIACAFDKPVYFEYLMNRFSTPEEVFGPVSIKALKEDRYLRKTESYLPTADFAFLDEIWKASPAILNTLLTLINERVFKNGETIEQAPLKALLAASNETPDPNQGLEALFDRFIVRLIVSPIKQSQHFERLLNSKPSVAEIKVPENLRVGPEEWRAWIEQIHALTLSPETMTIVHLIREKLIERQDALKVYVSDRRWQRAAFLMKAAAFFNGRTETNHSDAFLLQHCIWTHKDNHQEAMSIVEDAVRSAGIASEFDLAEIDSKKESLDREITQELFHSSDVYKTEKDLRGEDVFKLTASQNFRYWNHYNLGQPIYIPYKNIKSTDEFHPLDNSGNEIDALVCEFDGQGTCKITEYRSGQKMVYDPEILFHKGDKKDNVNERLVTSLSKSISDIRTDLQAMLKKTKMRFSQLEAQLDSLFVPAEKTNVAISGISAQIESLKLRIKDCERLEGLCG